MLPYEKEIKEYVEALKKFKPKLVILFGSIAKRSFGVGSDVDLLVVSDFLPDNFKERLKLLYEIETKAPLDLKGYKSEEIKRMILKGHPLILDALEYGIFILAEKDFLDEIMELYEREKKKFKRIERGWIRVA
ncbi:MAG: nucleotidyltransferase domain-containing protein [Archaeoglobaceae archaeon]|nr:nucleotidyltransferase domain-containing protein [Archaeoglobaceae archaeon]MDW8128884.1 nucleotidyltransferase domain-containing protein [Archaeoglobaceae archaeon]